MSLQLKCLVVYSVCLIWNNFPHFQFSFSFFFLMIICDPELQCRTELFRGDQLKAMWERRIHKQLGNKNNSLKICIILPREGWIMLLRNQTWIKQPYVFKEMTHIIHHTKQKQLLYKHRFFFSVTIRCNVFLTRPEKVLHSALKKKTPVLFSHLLLQQQTQRKVQNEVQIWHK